MEGNVTDVFQSMDNKWCCKTTIEECEMESTPSQLNVTNCIGKAISLQEQCRNNKMSLDVCNHYPYDPFRNQDVGDFHIERSFIDICNDNRYIVYSYSLFHGKGF